MEKQETKMWSYKMTHDTMMAPNPLGGILTLATCKPTIRKSKQTVPGVWIAGWTACTLHNSPIAAEKTTRCKMGEEKLIYLAKVSEKLSYPEYWEKYPQKRPVEGVDTSHVGYYGDNYYYQEGGENKRAFTNQHTEEEAARDWRGKYAIVCEEFYYFTPENRLSASGFESLINKGIGQTMKQGELVDKFIEYVKDAAKDLGYSQGIIGDLKLHE